MREEPSEAGLLGVKHREKKMGWIVRWRAIGDGRIRECIRDTKQDAIAEAKGLGANAKVAVIQVCGPNGERVPAHQYAPSVI